jgi:hypothetical protein
MCILVERDGVLGTCHLNRKDISGPQESGGYFEMEKTYKYNRDS